MVGDLWIIPEHLQYMNSLSGGEYWRSHGFAVVDSFTTFPIEARRLRAIPRHSLQTLQLPGGQVARAVPHLTTALVLSAVFCCLSAWWAFCAQWFLANEHSNYRKSKARGKAAHTAAVELSNLVADTGGAEGLIDLGRALARVGMGRDLYFVLTKAV